MKRVLFFMLLVTSVLSAQVTPDKYTSFKRSEGIEVLKSDEGCCFIHIDHEHHIVTYSSTKGFTFDEEFRTTDDLEAFIDAAMDFCYDTHYHQDDEEDLTINTKQ